MLGSWYVLLAIAAPMPSQCPDADTNTQKLGSARPDNRLFRDPLLSPTDSRPSTPKSVRPPLPNDVDAELRAACTYIVTHPKPSHERWDRDAAKPALDYAAIRNQPDLGSAPPARRASTRTRGPPPRSDTPSDPSKYSYRPNVAAEDLFRQDERDRALQQASSSARSRADQLMAPVEQPRTVPVQSHVRSSSRSRPQQQNVQTARAEERTRASARSDSVGTTGSTPHTDSTEYQWSASTPMTSAAITPARSSKRTSSQNAHAGVENASAPKTEPPNAEWMRLELEKHKKAIEERERERARLMEENARITADVTPTQMGLPSTTPISRVPPRKPVPSRPESRQAKEVSRPETRHHDSHESNECPQRASRGRADSARAESNQTPVHEEPRGRVLTRSNSKMGRMSRAATRAASRAASRAATKAEDITNDILGHYLRPGAHQDSQGTESRPARSPSRSRTPFGGVKEYFRPSRPNTAMGSRKGSVDVLRGHERAPSTDSYRTGISEFANSEHSKLRGWRFLGRGNVNAATPDLSRPGSSGQTRSPQQKEKERRPIDLNRELPPLPSLDQWKTADAEPEMPQRSQNPAAGNVGAVLGQGLRRALSKRSLATKNEIVAARVGTPTPPLSQKQSVDAKRSVRPINSPPMPLSPGTSSLEVDLHNLSLSRSIEPQHTDAASRARSKSNAYGASRAELRPEMIRNVSTPSVTSQPQSPVPTGNPSLVHYARSVMSGAPVADSRSVRSSNRKSNYSSATPYSHSRSNSDKMSRQYSVDDYNRGIDRRYQNAAEVRSTKSQNKEKSKRKWWGLKDRKQEQADWMDQVMQSGARNGMLVTDDLASGPIVRY